MVARRALRTVEDPRVGPKPAPSAHLLAPGQEWTIVEAPGWSVVDRRFRCGYWDMGVNCYFEAVAASPDDSNARGVRRFCDQHTGLIRWCQGDRVLQYRASPAWTKYSNESRYSGSIWRSE